MASLKIIDIRLAEISFELNDRTPGKEEETPYHFKVESQAQHKTTGEIAVRLRATSATRDQEPDYPFFFDILMIGTFQVVEGTSPDLMEQFAKISCPALMFPYLRETIADITRRAGFPALHLPPINFVKQAKNQREKTGARIEERPVSMAKDEKTSKKVASEVNKLFKGKKTSKMDKSVAASIHTQAPDKGPAKKK